MSCMSHWQQVNATYDTILFLEIEGSVSVNGTIIHVVGDEP